MKIEIFERPEFKQRPAYSIVIPEPGPFDAMVQAGTYYLRAYIDLNRNDRWDEGEPIGTYKEGQGVVVVPLASKPGIDIKLEDGKKSDELIKRD